MPTYVAITTINPQTGWSEVLTGTNKKDVQEAAGRKIAGVFWNEQKPIDVQTQLTNLKVVSKTKAKRTYNVGIDRVEYPY